MRPPLTGHIRECPGIIAPYCDACASLRGRRVLGAGARSAARARRRPGLTGRARRRAAPAPGARGHWGPQRRAAETPSEQLLWEADGTVLRQSCF